MEREELNRYLTQALAVAQFQDYCPNGLQVEGRATIRFIVTGVTANQELISRAIEKNADAIIVHHGFFWRNENPCVIGLKQRRLSALLAHQINLFAYHLPLDAHPLWGNNVQLGQRLGLSIDTTLGTQDLLCLGQSQTPSTLAQLIVQLEGVLQRSVQVLGHLPDQSQPLTKIAWCTGAAQSYFQTAIDAGAQVFISGEASEPCVHLAQESGVVYLVCGHHATERFGVQALGAHLASQFGLQHEFIEVDSPL